MDDGSRLPWIFAVILLFFAMFFAVTETAISACSKTKIRALAEHGNKKAETALFVLEHFDMAISTLLICTNIVHLTTASIVTVAVTKMPGWGVNAVPVSTIITTVVVFFAGEMLPKSVAKKYCDTLCLGCCGILSFLMKIFAPLSKALSLFGRKASQLAGVDVGQISVTEDELYDIIEDMTEDGSLNEEQGDLISSALQFGDVTVESVLTPRVDVKAIDIEYSPDKVLELIKATTHSRLPVYEGSIDNIIGILQIRKYIKAYLHMGKELDLRAILEDPFFIHQSTNIDELLPIMSKRKKSMAVVTDNYGGTLGIITVEDILEELVGEIWDEDDVVVESFEELGEGVYQVDADESVSDVMEHLEYDDPEEDEELVNTLMGEWAYEQFTAIPRIGDSFAYHRMSVTVSQMEHNRITKLKITLLPEDEEGGEEE